ncbi:DUF421 domain-containing protein [Terrilactibacillus sp. BCM23-1]|uniref:DUF421 domain-containing protein n=1 Tax=Terrilactibacillus tamarindi TaxID=2599694 RepID=A0A6N8CLF5_9BACI|nr:DUF421 domain-containing protein [Terrilactibacillus tamarindi]MTT30742.1 DUF421 domain-containing protein [Terrilactibacillus tamarindi]
MGIGIIALKLFLGLIGLLILVRLLGKKEMVQVTPFDFIYAIILSEIIGNAVYSSSISIIDMLLSLAVWGVLIYVIQILVQKNDKSRRVLNGVPSPLVWDGQLLVESFRKNLLEVEQFREMLRSKGIFSIKEVRYALLETNGTLSVMKHGDKFAEPSSLFVDEGEIEETELKTKGKNKEWLISSLKKEGYEKLDDIYCAEWSKENGFYVVTYSESKNNKNINIYNQ